MIDAMKRDVEHTVCVNTLLEFLVAMSKKRL